MTARKEAESIWQAGVDAVRPDSRIREFFLKPDPAFAELGPISDFDRILVVGAGKAGAAMSRALEASLVEIGVDLGRVHGVVNVPNETVIPLKAIRLHAARPAGTNQPTEAALAGAEEILRLVETAGPNDLLIALISGGGSALLPAPVDGPGAPGLADKQRTTQLLHECGATIQEMNIVRKHISKIKGGGLLRRFRGKRLLSLIISDVIGDPLDLIASGPTAVDPTTFADALAVIHRRRLEDRIPSSVLAYLQRGAVGKAPETLKCGPLDRSGRAIVRNIILANNAFALAAAERRAAELGYHVFNLGPGIQGDTTKVARALADGCGRLCRELQSRQPSQRGLAVLSGGETTVVLPESYGKGGRNQEFVLAFVQALGREGMKGITILCGGTDGEDGPTDAAGAFGDVDVLAAAEQSRLHLAEFLVRHDAYHFFEAAGGLFRSGLTETNVMDLRVVLIAASG